MSDRVQIREGWFSFLLLFLILTVVSISLQAAEWAEGLGVLSSVVPIGLLIGLLFAKSRLSGMLLHPLSLLLGFAWVSSLARLLVEGATWREELLLIGSRILLWAQEWQNGGTSSDTLPFVLTMMALMWLVSYGAAWDFYRLHNIWGVLIPSGLTILINTYYAPGDLTFLLVIYLVLMFLLIIRSNLLTQEERWRRGNIAFSEDIHLDFLRDGALFAVTVVALAWFLPRGADAAQLSPVFTQMSQPWGRAQQEWGRLFNALNYQRTVVSGTQFGRSMTFHGPVTLGDNLVMTVNAPKGRYWRAIVFDRYTSAGWTVTDQRMVDGPEANAPMPGAAAALRGETVEQQFTMYAPAGALLFTNGQPVQVNLGTRILVGGPAADQDSPLPDALVQLYARSSLYQGQSYSVISQVASWDEQSLREAGTEYPAWLTAHYTALPDTVPERVRQLAADITTHTDNPYDTARTIETYLRAFPYNESIAGPLPGEDGVDYFLFRVRQGYCDYYASAMAVMLRSLGIPARIAQGYNQGTLMESGLYEVRQRNAHTWVEVYFPGYGWVEFEPTASEPPIAREEALPAAPVEDDALPVDPRSNLPLGEMQNEHGPDQDGAFPPSAAGVSRQLNPRILLVPFALLAGVATVGTIGRIFLNRRWRGLSFIEQIYDQLGLIGRAAGERPTPTLTPREYAEHLGARAPSAELSVRHLAELFMKERFGGGTLDGAEVEEVRRHWQEARRELLRIVGGRFTGWWERKQK